MSLKRAYFIILITVIAFFLLYSLQAMDLYHKSLESQRVMLHSTEVITNIEKLNIERYQLQEVEYLEKQRKGSSDHRLRPARLQLMEQLSRVEELVALRPAQRERVKRIGLMLKGRFQDFGTGNGMDLETQEVLNALFSQLENAESTLLRQRTQDFIAFNKRRFSYSIGAYILLSALLLLSAWFLYKDKKKRVQAERSRNLIESRYQMLVEASGFTTTVLDENFQIRFASENVFTLTGYTPEEIIGKNASDFVPEVMLDRDTPVLTKADRLSYEKQFVTKGGERKWIAFRIFPLADIDGNVLEWQFVVWDIDVEKQLELKLIDQQLLLQNILNNLPSNVALKDLEGRYVLVNQRMEEMTGFSNTEIVGMRDVDVFGNEDARRRIRAQDEKVIRLKAMVTSEDVMEIKGQKEYLWVIRFPLLNEEGEVTNVCVLSTNITARKEGELKLMRATRAAENARIAQESFLANMSHEIRTPLNGIIGMSNLLLDTRLDTDQQEFAESILESGRHLLVIINDILDFSKIRSGKFRFDHSPFRLVHLIKKTIYPLRLRAEEKLITLAMQVDDEVPEVLVGDALRLQQILTNLVGNAVKFTSKGGVIVKIKCSNAKGQRGRIFLHVEVEDSGIGIPPDKLDYVFESFTQNNSKTSRDFGGTGLGLAIVKQLVELQGGTVEVNSELNIGSVFSFSIPIEIGKGHEIQEAKNSSNSQGKTMLLQGLRILVAEDNLINQKIVSTTLSRQGALVTIAPNGQIAVEELKAAVYNIILMDLQMPVMDGYAATTLIRRQMHNATPIIAMTADALKGEAQKCFEAGMNGYISKPFEPGELFAEIIKWTKPVSDFEMQHLETPHNSQSLIDLSYLSELSGNDPAYIREVLSLYLGTMPEGLEQLKQHIMTSGDWEMICRQSHFLKSSASVIRVGSMYEQFSKIETLSKNEDNIEEVKLIFEEIMITFRVAKPLLEQQRDASS